MGRKVVPHDFKSDLPQYGAARHGPVGSCVARRQLLKEIVDGDLFALLSIRMPELRRDNHLKVPADTPLTFTLCHKGFQA